MRRLKNKRGFTLTELLAATLIMALLGTAVAVGCGAAAKVYRQSVEYTNAQALSSTLGVTIADELRYARNLADDGLTLTFSSEIYGDGVFFSLSDGTGQAAAGHLLLGGQPVLGELAYTNGLRMAELALNYSPEDGTVSLNFALENAGGEQVLRFSAPDAPLVIRPLNA